MRSVASSNGILSRTFLDAELKRLEFRRELCPVTLPQSLIFKVRNYLVWTSFHHSLNLTEISLWTRLYLIVCIDVNLNISLKETKGESFSPADQLGSPQMMIKARQVYLYTVAQYGNSKCFTERN